MVPPLEQQSVGYMVRWLVVFWSLTLGSLALLLWSPSGVSRVISGTATILFLGVAVICTLAVLKIRRGRSS